MRRRWLTLASIVVLVCGASYVALAAPPGPRSLRRFDPDRVADLELRMWQAYYAKERVRLFGLLVTMLREQYRYNWTTAVTEGFHLARAAATFGDARDQRDQYDAVLSDLQTAYIAARHWLHAGFDPQQVARAELAWWVARRVPGHNSPEQVGALIADEYALLYEVPRPRVTTAALLRARAAALRDAQADHPDWPAIARLLTDSYRDLRRSLE